MIYYDLEEVLLKVDRLFWEDKYVLAKRLLQKVLEDEPGYGPVHYKLGWLYWWRLDDCENAEMHFKLALKFSPGYPMTYYGYAVFLNEVNDSVALGRLVTKAMKVKGVNLFFMHNELGKSFEMNGAFDKAVREYKTALRYTLIACEMDQLKGNIDRVNVKMYDASIQATFHSAALK